MRERRVDDDQRLYGERSNNSAREFESQPRSTRVWLSAAVVLAVVAIVVSIGAAWAAGRTTENDHVATATDPEADGEASSDPKGTVSPEATARPTDQPVVAADIVLPFGLTIPNGLTPVGRPMVGSENQGTHNDVPVISQGVLMVGRIDAGAEADKVFDAVVGQLMTLNVGELTIVRDGAFRHANGYQLSDDFRVIGDSVSLRQVPDSAGTLMVLSVSRFTDDRFTAVLDDRGSGDLSEMNGAANGNAGRTAGDPLFTEQDTTVHLPDGTTALTDTLPFSGGTGGSFTVLSAADGEAAIEALFAEAVASDSSGEEITNESFVTPEGATVHRVEFNISAGGWGFSATSIHAPGDETATIYVSSWAD